ncbi:MAG: cytochrome c, partial [Nitrospirae bacterium]|nr:cytochrome c [Nitrospirota bacterium]
MKNLLNLLVVTFLVLCGISSADAYSMYLDNVRAAYPNIAGSKLENCNICHNPDYSRNGFGSDFAANGHNLGAIEAMDSDGDGFSNIAEINAVTFPGNASDRPAVNGGPAPAPTGGPTMAMPGSQSVFDIQAGIFPFISALPENAKPIGVGPVAEGGDYLSVQVGLNAFAGAVDLYFVITLPGDTDNLYFLNPDNSISVSRVQDVIQAMASNRFPAGVQPWKKGSAGPVNEIILNSIPVADIITGTYGFYLLASPSGSLDRYYLWGDIVEVSDLAGRGGASDQMGKPDSRYDIPYGPSVYPVISQDPFKARPIGVGPIADGGTVVSLQVGVGKFISPMDLYMAYSVPAAPDKIYFMRPDYSVTAYTLNEVVQAMTAGGLPAGLEPWKKNTKGVINEIIQNNVPETSVNPGTYSYFMLAFPSGLTDRFYRWGTAFQAEGGPAGAMDPFAPAPRSMDGVSLYNQNCSICHGGLAASSLGGSTANDIKTAVSTIGMMKGLQGLIAQQISAIANAIAAAFQPPPTGTDGAALYSSYCAGCHGPLETSAKSGRTSGQIQAAVSGNIGGMGSPALAGLTTAQFDAIAGVLAGQTPPPPPPPPTTTDGATLYTTYCSGCHGPLATSAKLNKTAAQIQGAINGNIGGMGSPALMSLTPT